MAKLTDMEELASKVIDKDVQSYMREALTCYMTGAYRATIVLSYIALFDDIIAKLDVLAKVNRKAKKIHDEVSKKRNDQEVFESDLINQLSSNNLLSSLDTTFLDILRKLRNKAAHPSGHQPSAEEARFIYFESINRFLSKEILSTTQLADEILASTADKNLFPSTDISIIAKVVRKELESIHHETYSYLVNKLLDKVISSDDVVSKNASFFLTGMTFNSDDEESILAVKKFLIEKKSQDDKFYLMIIRVITSNPKVIDDIDDITIQRLKVLILERINSVESTLGHSRFSHPVSMFSSMFGSTEESILKGNFSSEIELLLSKFMYSSYLINNLSKSQFAKEKYLEVIYSKAGSSDFDTANYFARNCYDIADDLDLIFSEKDSYLLVLQVIKAADWGAFGSRDMRKSQFGSIPKIRDKARTFDSKFNSDAKELYIELFGSDTEFDNDMNAYVR